MIIKTYTSNQGFREQVVQGVRILEACRAFQLLYEICAKRGRTQPSATPMETSALNGAWMDGYTSALQDLYDLADIKSGDDFKTEAPGYATVAALHKAKEITDKEFNDYTAKHAAR